MRILITIAIIAATGWANGELFAQDLQPQENAEQIQDTGPTEGKFCLETDNITQYKVESDQLIRFVMRSDFDILMRVKRHCSQLYFHKYISYTPVNGLLCEGVDEIKTRSGLPCRIESLEKIEKKQSEETSTIP